MKFHIVTIFPEFFRGPFEHGVIQKAREAEFDAAVNKVAQKFGERLNFKYTGPWPPYNFVNIRLKLERGGQG